MEQKQKFLPTGKLAAGIKYTRDGIKTDISVVVDIDISNEMDSSSIHSSKKEYAPTTRYDAQYSAKNDLTQLSF